MSPDNKEDRLDQTLRDLRASGGEFPVREETFDKMWRRMPPQRSSATFRARIHALLDENAADSDRRRCGETLAGWRSSARLQPGDLAARLSVRPDEIAGLEAGRLHPAVFEPGFWLGFAEVIKIPRRELAGFLRGTAGLITGSFATEHSSAWATDLELPAEPAEAEAVLRTRLDQIIAALEMP